MNLFQTGNFKLNSGKTSKFKIECDALSDAEIELFAELISDKVRFKTVVGIPRGGLRLAKALEKYCTTDNTFPLPTPVLVVDDVLTTGNSMEKYHTNQTKGFVIFARGKCPKWIDALFKMEL